MMYNRPTKFARILRTLGATWQQGEWEYLHWWHPATWAILFVHLVVGCVIGAYRGGVEGVQDCLSLIKKR